MKRKARYLTFLIDTFLYESNKKATSKTRWAYSPFSGLQILDMFSIVNVPPALTSYILLQDTWYDIYTLNKNINATCEVSHVSWAEIKDHWNVPYAQKAYFSQILSTNVFISLLVSISTFAKIIHPPDICGQSRSWLNSMIITQVHLLPGTIKGHSKMCSFVTQHNVTDISSFEGTCNWHSDCRNVHQSCCQIIKC
jgi:hypothetical protein